MKTTSSKKGIAIIAGGLAIAYLPSYINKLLGWFDVQVGPEGPAVVILWNWIAVTALLAYVIWIERRKLASILLKKPKQKDIEWAFYFWGIAMGWNWLVSLLLTPTENEGTSTILSLSLPIIILLILTTATTEEILFRGYPIERLRELTGRLWIGVLLSFTVFVIPHLTFFGWEWLPLHGAGTVALYVLYVWKQNLYANMLLHFLINAPILIPATMQG